MNDLLQDLMHEFRRHKDLAERAMVEIEDEEFFRPPAPHVNSVATIVKHLAGNLRSRWTDFLTTDGEKPDRDRDGEFHVTGQDTGAKLLADWERGWRVLFDTVENLTSSDLDKTVTIRGETHTVHQALLRGMSHAAYHTGQIVYIVRMLRPDSSWLTIAPGQGRGQQGTYREPHPADGGPP